SKRAGPALCLLCLSCQPAPPASRAQDFAACLGWPRRPFARFPGAAGAPPLVRFGRRRCCPLRRDSLS
ncbi:unnamed protein product, partial [Amoebophrya sp. A120]